MKKLKVIIPNLTCASRVFEIEQVMRQQEGVVWAIVNFAAGEATIIYDPRAFRISQLVRAVNRFGFQILMSEETVRSSQTAHLERRPFARMQQWVRALAR